MTCAFVRLSSTQQHDLGMHEHLMLSGLQVDELIAGEVGYLAASIKAVADARVGDTITLKKQQAAEALAGDHAPDCSCLTCAKCAMSLP